jgi:hypothetical protein
MPVIPALERLRQEDHEFKTSLVYVRPCLEKKKRQIRRKNPKTTPVTQ